MTFRYTIAKNNMMMRMLFSRACNMARCFGMRCCSPENNARLSAKAICPGADDSPGFLLLKFL